jgi:hypothetical protein
MCHWPALLISGDDCNSPIPPVVNISGVASAAMWPQGDDTPEGIDGLRSVPPFVPQRGLQGPRRLPSLPVDERRTGCC